MAGGAAELRRSGRGAGRGNYWLRTRLQLWTVPAILSGPLVASSQVGLTPAEAGKTLTCIEPGLASNLDLHRTWRRGPATRACQRARARAAASGAVNVGPWPI